MTKKFSSSSETIAFVESLKKRWMATVDAIIDPLMIVDGSYKVTQANNAMAQHARLDIKELIGSNCYKALAGRDQPCKGCLLQNTLKNDVSGQFELDNVRPGMTHEVTSQPIHNENGDVEGVLQIYRDRTMAIQMQKQLLQNEKLASIGLLAGGIAHEINNPLGGILVFSQMLLKEIDPMHPHFEDVKEIESAAQRCKSIVENLLDFARQQPGIHEEKLVSVDLVPCLRSAIKFALVTDNVNEYEVCETYELESMPVLGNRNKAIQIFLNLIQNAFHAMPDGGKLRVLARIENETAIIEIEDTGVGIPEDELSKIFDPFYTSKPEGQGTGLGLAICHGIAEDMHGSISVTSTVGKGSCFTIKFPLQSEKKLSA